MFQGLAVKPGVLAVLRAGMAVPVEIDGQQGTVIIDVDGAAAVVGHGDGGVGLAGVVIERAGGAI